VRLRAFEAVTVALPGALTVYLSFNAGGYFPGTTALVALVLAVGLALRAVLVPRPFAGAGWPLAIAGGAVALFAAWVLASAAWSHAPARALVEFERVLLYLLLLLLFGSLARDPARTRRMLRGLVVGIFVVCVAALATRLQPGLWSTSDAYGAERLSYPLTYWNALGLLSSLGVVLSFHLASDEREGRAVRVLGAAAVPVLCACLVLTLSRGAIAAGLAGLAVYALVARPRGLAGATIAVLPAAGAAVALTYRAELLFTPGYAQAQGGTVALGLIACALAGALLRWATLRLDGRTSGVRLPLGVRRGPVLIGVLLAAACAALVVALELSGGLAEQYGRFVAGDEIAVGGDQRSRLTDPGNTGRVGLWRVAVAGFAAAPLTGGGAGTYALLWARERPRAFDAVDGHSLYLETLAEEGVVGLLLVMACLLSILAAFGGRARGLERAVYGALLAAGLAWALHAAIDWDWEMPAVTSWLFAFGGAALAGSRRAEEPTRYPAPGGSRSALLGRGALAAACAALAVVSALLALSQLRLEAAAAAFERGDCRAATAAARSALSILAVRPQPWEVIGMCAARESFDRRGVAALEAALDLDPADWRLHYESAVVRGSVGLDPRPAARRAVRLNPHSPLARAAATRLRGDRPRDWVPRSRAMPLPAPPFP